MNSEWLSIETSPRKGKVLLYDAKHGIVIGSFVKKHGSRLESWVASDWNYNCCRCNPEIIFPLFWQPLPDKPKGE